MKFIAIVFFFIFITNSFAQQLKVTSVKNTFIESGTIIKQEDYISVKNRIIIKTNGYVYLSSISGWTFYLKEGSYDLDSCYQINKRQYAEYDSVKAIIDVAFPNGLKGQPKSVCTTDYYGNFEDLSYRYGNIAFSNTDKRSVMNVLSDTATIYWRDPNYKGGRYFLVFKNMFDEIVGYKISVTNSCFVDFSKMDQYGCMVVVYSEDGRASYPINIQKVK